MQGSSNISSRVSEFTSTTIGQVKQKVDRFKETVKDNLATIQEEKEKFTQSLEGRKQRVLEKTEDFFASSKKLNQAREAFKQAKQAVVKGYDVVDQKVDDSTEALKRKIGDKLKLSEDSKIRKGYQKAVEKKGELKESLRIELQANRAELKEKIADLKASIKKLNMRGKIKTPSKLSQSSLSKVSKSREERLFHATDEGKAAYYHSEITKGLKQIKLPNPEGETKIFDNVLSFVSVMNKNRKEDPELEQKLMKQLNDIEDKVKYQTMHESFVSYMENKVNEGTELPVAFEMVARLQRNSLPSTEERIDNLLLNIRNKMGF